MKKALSVAFAIFLCISMFSTVACNSSKDYTYTCNICNRDFSGGTSDSKSIIRTHMCVNCYNNYKYVTGK